MKIRGKQVLIYDVEVFPNCFHCCVKNSKTKEKYHFEISERKNDYLELVNMFLQPDVIFCGYNNKHYDDPIINFLIENYKTFIIVPWTQICVEIKSLSDLIITSETSASWKKWKYANKFESMDLLTMLFSQKLRVGLKEMQVTMKFRNVQEYEGDFQKPIPRDQIENMIKYNDNDVDSTEELLFRCIDDIKLRLGIQKEYGINVLSMDGVSIGKEILKTRYLQDTGKTWNDIKDLRSPCDSVTLKDVILDKISYSDPILKNLLSEMKTLTVNPGREGWNKHFLFHNQEISIGVGGLHSINKPEKITVAEDEILLDADAALA